MKDSIQKLVDDIGVVGIAKGIIAGGKGYGISEHELTGLITDHAKRLYPSDRADTAFAKVVTAQTEDGFALRKALEVAKTTDYSMVVSVIGGQDAMDMVTDPKKAMEELVVIGRLKWPEERTDVQFARAIQDPANAELAARAHQRPMPTTNYPFPV